jgi:frataxin-like iron-binding protein CyaY
MISSSTSFRRIVLSNIEELFDSIDDEVRDSCDCRCECDDETRNKVFNDQKKRCFDHDQSRRKIWFANSTIFRRRWSYNSRIWLIKSITLTKKRIFDSTISIKMIEFEKFNCTNSLNRDRDCDSTTLIKKWSFRKI